MREIVKRETIETSITFGCSAANWATCLRCIQSRVSQRQFGLPERGQGKVGLSFGPTLYRLWLARGAWTEVRGCSTQWPSLGFEVGRLHVDSSPQGLEVGYCMQFKDADEMVLNDPS